MKKRNHQNVAFVIMTCKVHSKKAYMTCNYRLLVVHENENMKQFECNICNTCSAEFTSHSGLYYHRVTTNDEKIIWMWYLRENLRDQVLTKYNSE